MFSVILYFSLNFAGFFVFLTIWNWLPKPKPLDYTTIPGLKLAVSSAEELPELVKSPAEHLNFEKRGHFDELKKNSHGSFRRFLQFMHLTYGPLSSFWYFDRYVVIVSNENFVSELKKFSANLLAISPFAIGSYLKGDKNYSTTAEYGSFKNTQTRSVVELDAQLTEEMQNRLIFDGKIDISDKEGNFSAKCLGQAGVQYKTERNLRKTLGRPLLIVFNEQIWIDAHPIPKFIPIIIQTEEIIRNWSDDELFPKFYSQFYWIPGFSRLNNYF